MLPVMIVPREVTVKPLKAGDVPAGVVTAKVRVSVAAPAAIVTLMGRLLAVPPVPIVAVTPLPLKLDSVAPAVFDPVTVAPRLVPAAPEDGVIPVMIGPPDVTVKPLKAGDVPAGVVTAKVRVSVAAPAAIVIVMGRLLAVPPVPIVAVTPLPLKATAVAPSRSVPVIVAGRLLPAVPEDGVIPVIAGNSEVVADCLNSATTKERISKTGQSSASNENLMVGLVIGTATSKQAHCICWRRVVICLNTPR